MAIVNVRRCHGAMVVLVRSAYTRDYTRYAGVCAMCSFMRFTHTSFRNASSLVLKLLQLQLEMEFRIQPQHAVTRLPSSLCPGRHTIPVTCGNKNLFLCRSDFRTSRLILVHYAQTRSSRTATNWKRKSPFKRNDTLPSHVF